MEGLVAHRLLKVEGSASIGTRRRRRTMLETIAVILIILWLLGMVSGYTLGNFIYVLLVVAIVLFLVRLISGRRV
jgi:cation transporter-like permease